MDNANNTINTNSFIVSKKRKRDNKEIEEVNSSINANININKEKFKIEYLHKNPNFIFNSTIIDTNDGNLLHNKFETYLSYKDKKLYLVSPNHFSYQLYILCLNNNKILRKQKGHSYFVTSIRYFFNKTNNNEYLLSSDANKWVILWDINNNFDKKVIVNCKYKNNYIYSCLILFNIFNSKYLSSSNSSTTENDDNSNNNSFIVISSNTLSNENYEYTNIYLLRNGAFIKNTYNNNTNYLLSWANNFDNKEYIIELCSDKVIIYNIFDDDIYCSFDNGINYMSGFILHKDEEGDFLYTNSIEKYIYIYNINRKILINTINIGGWSLYNLIQWNEKYLIIIDSYKKALKIIDVLQGKAINCLGNIHSIGITSIKKINHPIYGESILTSGKDNKIKLWVLK